MYRFPLILLFASGLAAQPAEEIAGKSIEAMGGEKAFATIQSMRVQGRMRSGTAGEFNPFTMVAQRPDRLRMELTIGSDHVIQAYDGAIGWQSISGEHPQEPTPLTGDSLAHLIDQAVNAIGGPLVDRAKRHNQFELAGRETVNGAECFKLKVTLSTGDIRMIFIDPDNFREVQEELPMKVNGNMVTVQQSVSEYRKFGPVLMACLFITREKNTLDSQRLEIDSVELNPPVDPALFKLTIKK